MRYLIGVDGGGTGTRARVCSPDGNAIGVGESGPSALGQGIDQAWLNIGRAIADALTRAGLDAPLPAECGLALGLAGAHVGSRRAAFLAAAPAFGHLLLSDDGSTSLFGALQGKPGAIIAVGTGSIGEALWADGQRRTVGGWGFGIGDEAGGAWLGLQALRHAHGAQDGRWPGGSLAQALFTVCGRTREDLLSWGEEAGQAAYARLAPLVFDHEASDPLAAGLLANAVAEIERTTLALDPGATLPLVVTGSIGQRLKDRLGPALRARLVEPAGDSAEGALWLLRRALQADRR